jgi:hypothetical protein
LEKLIFASTMLSTKPVCGGNARSGAVRFVDTGTANQWRGLSSRRVRHYDAVPTAALGDLSEGLKREGPDMRGESRKCWLPEYFYPPDDLQIIWAEGNRGYGRHVDVLGFFHVQYLR